MWVSGPRHVAVTVRRQAFALSSKRRFVRTSKYASGMNLEPVSVGGAYAAGRLPTVGAANVRTALPRHSGVLDKSLGLDRPPVECALARTGTGRMTPAKPVPQLSHGGS